MMRNCSIKLLLFVLIITLILPAQVGASNPDVYLPSNHDLEIPYLRNESGETIKLRGSENFKINWSLPAKIALDIVRDDSGNLYYTDSNGIYAVDSFGKLLWSYKLPTPQGLKYISLGRDGTIYAFESSQDYNKTYGSIFAFNRDGSVKWVYELDQKHSSVTFARHIGDVNGNFVFETETGIVSISPKGSINWTNSDILQITRSGTSFTNSNITELYTDLTGNIFVVTKDNKLYSLDSVGKIKWQIVNPGIGKLDIIDNKIYSLSSKGLLLIDASNGNEISTGQTELPLTSILPTDHNDSFYVSKENGISKIDHSGHEIWSYEIREMGYRDAYNLTSDTEGNVYFTNNGGSVYSLDKDGRERFILFIQNHSSSGSDIISDSVGNAYVLSSAGLTAIAPRQALLKILQDEKEIFFPVHPEVIEGTTVLPMRKIFEILGSSIEWNGETQTVTAVKGDKSIRITVGTKTAQINEMKTDLDIAPLIKDGNMMVPLRFVSETLGYKVNWDGDKHLIKLVSPNGTTNGNSPAQGSKTLFTNNSGRFYLLTDDKWRINKSQDYNFFINDDKEHYMIVENLNKADFANQSDLNDVADLIKINLEDSLLNSTISDLHDVTINGLKSVQFEAAGEYNKLKIHYFITLVESSDGFFLLQNWTLESKYKEAIPVFFEMVKSFRPMDVPSKPIIHVKET
jgi:hypothetical protein